MDSMWKPILNFEGRYEISSDGQVRNYLTGKVLNLQKAKNTGYSQVQLHLGGEKKRMNVHRVVAQHFLPDFDPQKVINHKNGNKQDNRVENLECCTQKENIAHSIRTGLTKQRGEQNALAKLDESQVRRIRQLKGILSQHRLAVQFNISRSVIKDILNHRTWKHVEN